MPTETYEGFPDGWHSLLDNAVVAYGAGPPPPAPFPKYGFNSFSSYDQYTRGASENSTQMFTRLLNDYGAFDWIKVFYSSGLPTTWSAGVQGEANSLCPAKHIIMMFNWTLGTIANGSKDVALTTYINSIPADRHVMLGQNEIDNHIGNNTDMTSWNNYVADMNHLYDLVQSVNPPAAVEVWDCFMEYTIEPTTPSTRIWQDFMTNPAKRDGIVWDAYWNNATVDKTGNTTVGLITAKMNHLGMTRWAIGEFGDRRQEDSLTPTSNPNLIGQTKETSDAHRATLLTARTLALESAVPVPEGLVYFNLVGATGDHRIMTLASGGPDVATKAVLASRIADSRAS